MNYDDWKEYNYRDELEDDLEESQKKREAEESMIDYMLMDM